MLSKLIYATFWNSFLPKSFISHVLPTCLAPLIINGFLPDFSFHFSSRGMNGEDTFEKEIAVTGTAAPGSVLYMGSFIVEKGTVSLWESRISEVPQAGFVQEKLALPRIGENIYMIVVQEESGLYGCVYQIGRMSEKTEQKLIDLRINLYEACMP